MQQEKFKKLYQMAVDDLTGNLLPWWMQYSVDEKNGGFYGVVIDITDDMVIVEFGNNKNCRIPMDKAAIVDVEKPEQE